MQAHIHMYMHTHMHMCMYACVCIHICICVCACVKSPVVIMTTIPNKHYYYLEETESEKLTLPNFIYLQNR